ncbi:rhodanese-like domain-containing protein [Methanococcoides sp. AM1]|uniref:rhodanese-like domain-containing protein n=1 Tax=Methanococcoides sp. AM1 TaxID=1201011 RepID=UPI0010836052|nr:rhodanese-like domain-containing protein [Methanococcoides sp. AM1]
MISEKIVLVLAILVVSVVILGCADPGMSDQVDGDNATAGYTDVSVQEAKEMIDSGDVFLLDVRTVNEFETEHIEGAVNIDVNELGSRLDEVPQDETILVYCRTGVRSAAASNILVDAGYTDVYNMLGGISQWKAKGYPYVSGP